MVQFKYSDPSSKYKFFIRYILLLILNAKGRNPPKDQYAYLEYKADCLANKR